MNKYLLLIISLLLFVGCFLQPPFIKHSYREMKIIYEGESFPENYSIIGEIFVGRTDDVSQCDYASALNKATKEAEEFGGNAIKITKILKPTVDYECYRVYALVLITND